MAIKKNILIVDDDEISRNLLKEVLDDKSFQIDEAGDGKEGLELYTKKRHPVIITDLEMPVMDGREMISQIKDMGSNAIIIILSAHDESETIIENMKLGVYDFIIKSGNTDEMKMKITRAIQTAELLHLKTVTEKEKIVKLHEQLQWCEWNDKILKRDKSSFDKALFQSLQVSFSQGTGIGTMLTLLRIISESAEKKGDKFIVDAELFEVINENARFAENAINTFSEIHNIINGEMPFENLKVDKLYFFINDIITEMRPLTEKNEQNILLSDKKEIFNDFEVAINKKFFKDSIYELIINALKFSKKNSDVFVLFDIQEESKLSISILNTPSKSENGIYGIPIEFEHLVFEPFYRMSKKIYPDYKTLDYGLGLTLVEKIIGRHNGTISVLNITDYSKIDKEPVEKVDMTLELPLVAKK